MAFETRDYGIPQLELEHIIGFNGAISDGLKVHKDKQHIIYPLGCTIIIENLATNQQEFLSAHTNEVTCVAVSNSGKYIASGQKTHRGFKADINIWDYEKRSLYATLTLHKVKVQALAFSPNDKFLVSLGGSDDGSVVVWDIATKNPICGSPAQVESAGTAHCVCFSNENDFRFVTGGDGTLRVWDLDLENRKIRSNDVNMAKLKKRKILCIEMADNYAEPVFLCGTTTGDIIGVNMETNRFQFLGPTKDGFSLGVTSLTLLKNGSMIIGAGDGTICEAKFNKSKDPKTKKMIVEFEKKKEWRNPKDPNCHAVTSIAKKGSGHDIYIGTRNSEIFKLDYVSFSAELIKTCHSSSVNDIIFPHATSQLFLTCQDSEIRIWLLDDKKELIRKVVPNMICNALDITEDGKTIISAWNDGTIKAFGIQLKPPRFHDKFVIRDAHERGVTAVKCTRDGKRILSGGGEGQVRSWVIDDFINPLSAKKRHTTPMEAVMKEHKGSVSDIKIRKNDTECVSASSDGTCIIWDMINHKRQQIFFSNTLFKCVCYGDLECQILTSGTDRKIAYWEGYDGAQVRELEGSKSGSVNALDISTDCQYYVSGGDDKLIKVWKYKEGEVTHVGIGHSGPINKVRICPNRRYIVSVSNDGAVLIWKFPC